MCKWFPETSVRQKYTAINTHSKRVYVTACPAQGYTCSWYTTPMLVVVYTRQDSIHHLSVQYGPQYRVHSLSKQYCTLSVHILVRTILECTLKRHTLQNSCTSVQWPGEHYASSYSKVPQDRLPSTLQYTDLHYCTAFGPFGPRSDLSFLSFGHAQACGPPWSLDGWFQYTG